MDNFWCVLISYVLHATKCLNKINKMYDVHLGLIGKRVVDFLLVIIEFLSRCYSKGATGENRSKIGDFAPTWSVLSKISGRRGRSPPLIFAWIVTAIFNFAVVFTQRNFAADFLQSKCDFRGKTT